MSRRRLFRLLPPFLVALVLGVISQPARGSAAVQLDKTFGTNGKTVVRFSGIGEVGRALVVQTDGKLLLAGGGCCQSIGSGDLALVRLKTNGKPDTTFGQAGSKLINLSTTGGEPDEELWDLAASPGGKYVGVGDSDLAAGALVARFLSTGALDTSFGSGKGWVSVSFGESGIGLEVLVRNDGRIVVGGTLKVAGQPRGFALARLLSTGQLDTTFGSGGVVTLLSKSIPGLFGDMALDPQGRLLVVGRDGNAWRSVRLKTDGKFDPTFGTGGQVLAPVVGSAPSPCCVAVAPDGKIVIGGGFQVGSDPSTGLGFAVARALSNGQLDTSFGGGDGFVSTGSPVDQDQITDLLVEPGGKIVATGRIKGSAVLVRYLSNGNPDTGFGVGGILKVGHPEGSRGEAVARDAQGRLYLVGNVGLNAGFLAARTTAK